MSDGEEEEDEDEDGHDLLQEICDNLRTDKAGRVSFTELERSISLCIGHLLAEDDRDKMIQAFKEIEGDSGRGVPLANVPAVLTEWMSGSDQGNNNNNNNNGDDMFDDDAYGGGGGGGGATPMTPRQRKSSFAGGGTSFFTDDGDEQSQIYHEMEMEVAMLRKKLTTTSQDSLKCVCRCRSSGWLVGLLVGWWLVGWLAGLLVGWLIGWPLLCTFFVCFVVRRAGLA